MKNLRIGIVGCGVVAPAHAGSYRKIDGVELAWACDLVEDKARALAAAHGIARTTVDYRAMLRDRRLDAVSICTDHASHAPIAAAALRAGKHVLCEKALAATARGMAAMFRAHARRPDLVFSGVFQHRFDPITRYLKGLVDARALGTILTANATVRCLRTNAYYQGDAWRGTWQQEGGSILINQAIHFIDALSWVMGGVATVSGAIANLTHQDVIETEDTAAAALQFRCGALGTIEATCSSHVDWETTLALHGTVGSVEVRDDRPLKVDFRDAALQQKVRDEMAALASDPGLRVGKTYYGAGHPGQIADFVDAVRNRRAPFVPAASARHTVDIVLAIYSSHRTGRRVSVPDTAA